MALPFDLTGILLDLSVPFLNGRAHFTFTMVVSVTPPACPGIVGGQSFKMVQVVSLFPCTVPLIPFKEPSPLFPAELCGSTLVQLR